MRTVRCPYCQQSFQPSIYPPQQSVCSQPACQRQRRTDYHHRKIQSDPEYRQVVRDSQKKWRAAHPDYHQRYRETHPATVERNREQQRQRDQKRRVGLLVKNNVALDLKHSVAAAWLLGPGVKDLAKNNLASCQLLIFQSLAAPAAPPAGS